MFVYVCKWHFYESDMASSLRDDIAALG